MQSSPGQIRFKIIAVLLAIVCGAARAGAQQSTPVIRSQTSGVLVDVIVTDHKGHHVRGLTAGDFRVYEDNTPQTIASFTPSAARGQTVSGSNATTAPVGNPPSGSAAEAHTPQLITVLMDLGDMHQQNLKSAYTAASTFAEKAVAAGDLVAVYWVDSSLHLAAPFTREPQQLRDVFEKLSRRTPSGRLTAYDRRSTENEIDDLFTQVYPQTLQGDPPTALASGMVTKGSGRISDDQQIILAHQQMMLQEMNVLRSWLTIASSLQARAVFVALRALAVSYRGIPGRKTLMVFSEGFLHSPSADGEMQGVVDAAQRANVAIYVIDAGGLDTGTRPEVGTMDMGLQTRATKDFYVLGQGQQAAGLNQFDWMQTLASDPDTDLGNLAHATGGFLVRNMNDVGQAIDRVLDDASEFYTLMYYSSNPHFDGSFRQVRVELIDRGDHLRYRQGYWALPPGREIMMTPGGAQLLAAVETGNRKPSFTPEVNAALAPAADGRFGIAVAVSMPGRVVKLEKLKDEYLADVNALLVARDKGGEILAVQERYGHLRLSRAESEQFSASTFTLQGHVGVPELQPVSVQAIVQFSDGTLGMSARTGIIPAPAAAGLRLSSLVLADKEEDADCSAEPLDPLCLNNRRIVLPAHRTFAADNRLVAYCSVMGLKLDDQQKPDLRLWFSLEQGTSAKTLKPLHLIVGPGYGVGKMLAFAVLDLKGTQAGNYRLRLIAEDERQHAQVSEATEFDLR